jgi:tetrahydromethanopterin S-methyltransferase subunit G
MFRKETSEKAQEKKELKNIHKRLDRVEGRVDLLEKQRQVMRREYGTSS